MSIIMNAINNMSEADKNKLGKGGTKVNTDGAHLLTVTEAYEIDDQRFYLECEDSEGKTISWTGFLKQKVGKDKDGNVRAGEYSVNGQKVHLTDENAEYDNLRVIGQINNLWKICGLDAAQFGVGITPGTVTFAKAGVKNVERWQTLIGKQFTGVSSFLVTLDADGKKAWRNQALNMDTLFTKTRLSQAEVDSGKTEPLAIEAAITAAKANASIEYKNKNNKICIQELQLIKGAGQAPATEDTTATKTVDADIF
jgi:hypothetical protein